MEDANSAGDLVAVKRFLDPIVGKQFIQFRMGACVHLDLGFHLVTIEAPLTVTDGNTTWTGEPICVSAAAALLPLISRRVTSISAATDGSLTIDMGEARISIPPLQHYEA